MSTLEKNIPLEIHYNILDRLPRPRNKEHPFLVLSQVCHSLRNAVDAYCLSELRRMRNTQDRSPKGPFTKKGFTARRTLLSYEWSRCALCHRSSKRGAVMRPDLTCCKACDEKTWPRKMKLSEAIKRYRITREQLRAANAAFGQSTAREPHAAVVLEGEVRRVAAQHHTRGDVARLDEHLRRFRHRALRRGQAADLEDETKKLELRALLEANGLDADALYPRMSELLGLHGRVRPASAWRGQDPRAIVRDHLLTQRLLAETDYAVRRWRLLDAGYVESGSLHAFLRGVSPDEHVPYNGESLHALANRNPRDEALAALFIKDFGPLPPESSGPFRLGAVAGETRRCYEPQPGEIDGFPTPRFVWFCRSASTSMRIRSMSGYIERWPQNKFPLWEDKKAMSQMRTPWSWTLYPVFVRSGYFEDRKRAEAGEFADEAYEREVVERLNDAAEAEFNKYCEWVRMVVKAGGLGGDSYEAVDEARARWSQWSPLKLGRHGPRK